MSKSPYVKLVLEPMLAPQGLDKENRLIMADCAPDDDRCMMDRDGNVVEEEEPEDMVRFDWYNHTEGDRKTREYEQWKARTKQEWDLYNAYNSRHDFPLQRDLARVSLQYQLLKCMSKTNYDAVYEALRIKDKQRVVLKLKRHADPYRQPIEVALMHRAQTWPKQLKQGIRVPRILGWHPIPETCVCVLVMEHVPHDSIRTHVMPDPLKIRVFMRQVCRTIHYLHSKCKLIHRDMKLSNVLWNEEQQQATVIDFDVSTFFEEGITYRHRFGTSGYIAPEMAACRVRRSERRPHKLKLKYTSTEKKRRIVPRSQKGYDQKVDVYSVGVLFAQLVFQIGDENLVHQETEERCSGAGFRHRIQRALRSQPGRLDLQTLEKMLEPVPAERPSMAQVLEMPYFQF